MFLLRLLTDKNKFYCIIRCSNQIYVSLFLKAKALFLLSKSIIIVLNHKGKQYRDSRMSLKYDKHVMRQREFLNKILQ